MQDDKNPGTCTLCHKDADERCNDGACRPCHKSLDFEDCVNGTWNAAASMRLGYSREALREMYPAADLDRAGRIDL